MGLLQTKEGTSHPLTARTLVGRGGSCGLRLDARSVSGEHALISWSEGRWWVRDLASRNGTRLSGVALTPGVPAALEEGAEIELGGEGGGLFRVESVAPPGPCARDLAAPDRALRTAEGGVLALPGAEPEALGATVFEDADGDWVLERADAVQPVADGQLVEVAGRNWQLHLPVELPETLPAQLAPPSLPDVELRLAVSRDEEHVEAEILVGPKKIVLEPRSFHYLLVTLARQRLADEQLPEAERGWLDANQLCRMLATSRSTLNVHICRARQQIGAAGIRGAAGLIERRAGHQQLRLGVTEVVVDKL